MPSSSSASNSIPPDEARDSALIARVREGDPTALDALARTYGAPLIRYAARTVGTVDRAREVVQDIFLRLWRDRATLEVTHDVAAYLFWLTRNHATNVAYSDRAAIHREGRWATEMRATTPTPHNTGETAIEAAEARAAVWEALATVPPRCREIFMLVWDDQLPYAEVANMLGISVPTVRNQMSRALRHLVNVLGPRFKRP
jgi:RNA polymerase sigma-70 factor (ECF subfamily)